MSPTPGSAGDFDLAFDGWSVSPDPDFVLSIHTCGALPATRNATGATDDFICDKTYDRLYARQSAEYDSGEAGGWSSGWSRGSTTPAT